MSFISNLFSTESQIENDPFVRARVRLLNTLYYIIASVGTFVVVAYFLVRLLNLSTYSITPWIIGLTLALWIPALVKQIPFNIRAALLIAVLVIVGINSIFSNQGLNYLPRVYILVAVFLVVVFFGLRVGAIMGVLATAAIGIAGLMVINGWGDVTNVLPAQYETFQGSSVGWIVGSFFAIPFLIAFSAMAAYFVNVADVSLERQHQLTVELEKDQESLEARVSEQTRALELMADVNRTLSTILDRDHLVIEIVEQVKAAFDYYHVHIYLYDENQQSLEMIGGTGEAGKALLFGKHNVAPGQGLVGRAAVTNLPILVADVRQDPDWLPNPLLPETRAEIAVPIATDQQIRGVLDVQHNIVNGLDNSDLELLENVANQIGVALRNTDLYSRATSQAERVGRINEIGQQIQLSPTIELVVQTAVRELGRELRAVQTSITIDPQEATLEEAA